MIKKLYAAYILATLWLIAVPLTVVYVALIALLYQINPVELFIIVADDVEIDNAWNWRKIKRAFAR